MAGLVGGWLAGWVSWRERCAHPGVAIPLLRLALRMHSCCCGLQVLHLCHRRWACSRLLTAPLLPPRTDCEQDAAKPKPAKKAGKAAAAPPKLDDAASWPSIGGAPVADPAKADEEEAEEEEEVAEVEVEEAEAEVEGGSEAEEGEIVEAAKPAEPAAAEPTPAATNAGSGAVSVKLDVAADGSVALTLTA